MSEVFNIESLDDKILNLDRIMKLSDSDRKSVLYLFDKLTKCFKIDTITAQVIYNTLIEYDYLVTRREKRLEDVLEKNLINKND
jgi:hypothetical protein